MSTLRKTLIRQIAAELGSGTCTLIDEGTGWPGVIDIQTSTGKYRIAVHVGPIDRLYPHSRPDDWRVQNPGSNRAIINHPGMINLALGWDPGEPSIIVACNADKWMDNTRTSQVFKINLIHEARQRGWAKYKNKDGEMFYAFQAFLLPVYVDMILSHTELPVKEIQTVLDGSGVIEEQSSTARERARQASSRLVRDSKFRSSVISSYGARCAMCSLGYGLTIGAHIYPASADNSPDEVWNGLCLCPNHHDAFDDHLIWVHPTTHHIYLHPRLEQEKQVLSEELFIRATLPQLIKPTNASAVPRSEMFEKRYNLYEESYGWVLPLSP